MIDSTPYPFYVVDAHDYTIKMTNLAVAPEILSRKTTCYELSHNKKTPCRAPEHTCPIEVIKKTKKPKVVEHIQYDGDGNARNVEMHCYPILDRKGSVDQIIEYVMDITDRKKAEEAKMLKKFSEMMINF